MATTQTIKWRQVPLGHGWDPEHQDAVVWIDVGKLDQSWRKDGDYVGPVGAGSNMEGRYQSFGEWVGEAMKAGWSVFMPDVCLDDDTGEIVFNDGRHRFAWLRDHRAAAMPVSVPLGQAATIRARFGTRCRKTTLAIG
jgi:hypothetical protein